MYNKGGKLSVPAFYEFIVERRDNVSFELFQQTMVNRKSAGTKEVHSIKISARTELTKKTN